MTEALHYLTLAARLGRRNLGNTAENPSVGCILVKDNCIIARGVTAPGGRPHAEATALERAGAQAKGCTAYVTLEPCAHHGKTPPCAEALVKAGVARVVYAVADPDPRVNGAGDRVIRESGIQVEKIQCAEAEELHAGFVSRITRKRPYVTLKMAISADGKIAGPGGARVQISNDISHKIAHLLRAESDAILVGVNTVIHDDPLLTCRLPGLENRSPMPVVMDGSAQLPKTAKLLGNPLWIFTKTGAHYPQVTDITQIFYTDAAENGTMPVSEVCHLLAEKGISRLLVEGGKKIAESFLRADAVDEIILVQSPNTTGPGGVDAPELEGALHGFRVRFTADHQGDRIVGYTRVA